MFASKLKSILLHKIIASYNQYTGSLLASMNESAFSGGHFADIVTCVMSRLREWCL